MPTPKNGKAGAKKALVKNVVKEGKSEIFIRLATPRVEKILKALRILGNCSNRGNYAYSQEQVDEMFNVITTSVRETFQLFTKSKKEQESFSFTPILK